MRSVLLVALLVVVSGATAAAQAMTKQTTTEKEVMTSATPSRLLLPNLHAQTGGSVSRRVLSLKHSPRYLTATKLGAGIRRFCRQGAGGCALRGQAFVIEDVGWRYRIHPGFMVAAGMTESSGGDAAIAGDWETATNAPDLTALGMFTFQWSDGMATMYPVEGVVALFGPGRSVV